MKSFISTICALGIATMAATAAFAQDENTNFNVEGNDRTALIPSERMKKGWYDSPYHFSPAVRAGDFIFVSGTVAGAFEGDEPIGKEAFQKSLRRSFGMLEAALQAGGASLKQVVKMRTFHVFDSKWITIPKTEQILAVGEVKDEFIGEPHPAWTAVGTTELFPDKGLVEIEVVVYAPVDKK